VSEYSKLLGIYHEKLGEKKSLTRLLRKEKDTRRKMKIQIRRIGQAIQLVQRAAGLTQSQIQIHISPLVTRALRLIFSTPLDFVLSFRSVRGRSEAVFQVCRPGGAPIDPLESSGGGVIDVVSFALKICLWCMQTPRPAPVMILDEPFRYLSGDLIIRAGELLRELSDQLNMQFIIITHSRHFISQADRLFQVRIKNGVSRVA